MTKTNLCSFAGLLLACGAMAQGTAFTYHGRLSDNGAPATGTYDLRFLVFGANSGGAQIGPTLDHNALPIGSGEFAVMLDFGAGVFTGDPRWLQIAVRTNGSLASYVPLAPRQPITATPYAIHAGSASNLLGSVAQEQLPPAIPRLNSAAAFTGAVSFKPLYGPPFAVNSTNKVNLLNADLLDGLDSAAFAGSLHTHAASNIVAGTLADARLSANVARLASNQVFAASNRFTGVLIATNAANVLAGNGRGLTNLNASNLVGVLPPASLPASVASLASNQTFSGLVNFAPPGGAPFRVGSASLVPNLNSDQLDGYSASAFWNLAGNTNPAGAAFLGTTDNSPLELRVNNTRALRLLPGQSGATLLAGGSANQAAANISAAVALGAASSVMANYATVSGGNGNEALADSATVAGGYRNSARLYGATVAGGAENVAGGDYSLAAGYRAQALHRSTFVWSDYSSSSPFTSTAPYQVLFRSTGGVGINTNNPQTALHVAGTVQASGLKLTTAPLPGALLVGDAAGNASWQPAPVRGQSNAVSPNVIGGHQNNLVAAGVVGATIGGGGTAADSNYVAANFSTIAGGAHNAVEAGADYSSVSGGRSNLVRSGSTRATINGGEANTVHPNAPYATIGGGYRNTLEPGTTYGAIGGGLGNSIRTNAQRATIGGGETNSVLAGANYAAIGGGYGNKAGALSAAVAGGRANQALGQEAAIGGGSSNLAAGLRATIAGGSLNTASNYASTVAGGENNRALADYSFAAGRNAQALHPGSFVWADSSSTNGFASGGANQFLIRAAGGVGIGDAPQDSKLYVNGNVRLNNSDLLLRGGSDYNHGLGWYGGSKTFAYTSFDGPVLFGYGGGALAVKQFQDEFPVLQWDASSQVVIGTPEHEGALAVMGGVVVDQIGYNDGNLGYALTFGAKSGEGIGSKRTPGGNRNGLDFYTAFQNRMAILNNGNIGLGTLQPNDRLEIDGYDAAVRIKNNNDNGLGGFIENTYGSLQLGMFSETNTAGQVAGGTKRAFFGFNSDGLVGSLVNTLTTPNNESFRNLLDDGQGNMTVANELTISKSNGQLIDLGNANHGIGVQNYTTYFRTDDHFAWYQGGTHNPNAIDPGGGALLMHLNGSALDVKRLTASSATAEGQVQVNQENTTDYARIRFTVGGDASKRWDLVAKADRLNFYSAYLGGDMLVLDGGGLTVRGTFVSSSDRNAKENYEAVNPREVLEKVAALPLTRWNFKSDPGTPHLGPVAQDFHAAFGVGADDKHIATVDADGVALAAIQGLNQKLEEKLAAQDAALKAKDAELQDLRQSVEELKALVRQSASPAAGAHPTD
jgi:hypothetical protein